MPAQGLSLVGFMERDQAHLHLTHGCIGINQDQATLDAEWAAAKARLGAPVVNAGLPDILPIPPEKQQYIAQLAQLPWVQPVLAQLPGTSFQLVEIDKLLAFQHTIMVTRTNHHCSTISKPPTLDELLDVCLPLQQANEPIMMGQTDSSVLLKAESLNIRLLQAGNIHPGIVGIQFGLSLPLVHVVRHNGRCYLHNGFHRALGMRQAGATHIPCMFRDVATHAEVGILQDGGTFDAQLLESANPPTMEHYTQGRAYDVELRRQQRFIHVSWAQYGMPME